MQETLSSKNKEMANTTDQYKEVVGRCMDLYVKKAKDYGTSWRVLRPISIVDQIYIKAWRIRQIQEKGVQKIQDSVESEFIGIVNYGIIALIQMVIPPNSETDLSTDEAKDWYEREAGKVEELMLQKNHDYGEAWRDMRISSITDIILMKLYRTKQIEDNQGQTLISEGVEANYRDMINYAVFVLIKLNFTSHEAH